MSKYISKYRQAILAKCKVAGIKDEACADRSNDELALDA